jgi:hypothetical protein
VKISNELRESVCDWLRANGIDPANIPVDPHMTLVGDQLTTLAHVLNADGHKMLDPATASTDNPTIAVTAQTYTITTPPPDDVAAWLKPRCHACGR